MGFRLPGMGDWTMPTANVENAGPGTYAEYMASHPDAWAGNGTDYANVVAATYGTNPGSYEDWSWGKEGDDIRQQYDKLLSGYQQGQALIDSQYKFAPDQKLTGQQLSDLGLNLHSFEGYDKQNSAWAYSPITGETQLFVQNPDGTYIPATSAPAGLSGGYRTIQINNPNQGGSWTDYMDAAITVASALGAGYAGAGAIGAAFAPEVAALGSTGAGSIDAYMAGAGLDAGTFGGAAFTMPELAAAEAIPFELPDGTMGSIQNGNILDASGNVVAKGGVDISAGEVLRYANQARQGLGIASTLSKLLGGGATGSATGGAKTGGTSGLSPQEIAKYLSGMATPAQAGAVPYQIKMNQNPFTFDIPGQTKATEGMYDVSGVNPMANALRKA